MMLDLTEDEAAAIYKERDARRRREERLQAAQEALRQKEIARQRQAVRRARGAEILCAAILELRAVCEKHGIGLEDGDNGGAFVRVDGDYIEASIDVDCNIDHKMEGA